MTIEAKYTLTEAHMYIAELEREQRFLNAQLDALVTTFHSHATAQAARISDLERHLQAQLDRRPA